LAVVRLYKLAADQGLADAQVALGKMYENGEGGSIQPVEAVRLYQLAADQGDGWGLIFLGNMHEFGKGGLTKDKREAARLYQQAVDAGYLAEQDEMARVKK
jgi:TPR repeat protein